MTLTVYEVFAYAVWAVFVYLSYRTLCIQLAGFRRRRQLRRELDRWNGAEAHVPWLLVELEKLRAAADRGEIASRAQLCLRGERLCQSLIHVASRHRTGLPALPGNTSAERVLAGVLSHELHGRTDLAVRERDRYFQRLYFRCEDESEWTTAALRFGLLGTVGGAAAAFAASGDAEMAARMAALSFALYTTAVGLVLAIAIDFSYRKVFQPAFDELCAAAEEALLSVSAKVAELTTKVAHTQSSRRSRSKRPDANSNGHGRPPWHGHHGDGDLPGDKVKTPSASQSESDHVETSSNKK